MSTPSYKHSCEWRSQLSGISNLCFAPHKGYCTGMRERHVVQYPFVRMISEGKLTQINGFEGFTKGNMLIFCSYRLPTEHQGTRSLDIVVYSRNGSVSLFECKVRVKKDGESGSAAAKKLSCAACQLSEYAKELIAFGDRSIHDPLPCLSQAHYYARYQFRALSGLLATEFGLKNDRSQRSWARDIVESVASNRVQYGLVFNGPQDGSIAGYEHVDRDILMDATKWGWHNEFGTLHSFMTNHNESGFEEL